MTLTDVLATLGDLAAASAGLDAGAAARPVKAVVYDSRKASAGALFFALKGEKADGTAFAVQALARGAVAVVSESPRPAGVEAPWIVVADARLALARTAAAFYEHPSRELRVVGITGTNGKTTTAYLVASLFEAAGIKCGILGTVVYRVGDEERAATRTTPESADIQQMLREMVKRGCGACAMEVSSHALAQRRVDDVLFAAGIFSNLTRDHLDYHHDMESYFRAKRRLFEMLPEGAPGVVNLDDPRGPQLVGVAPRTVTYALEQPADVHPVKLTNSLRGLEFDVATPHGEVKVRSSLIGRPNVYNMLAAVAAGVSLDLPIEAIERGLAGIEGIPGRFQLVSGPDDDIAVIVDYAHTDDALKNLLETVKPLARRRLITVFGCGGDRDRTKRPLMGAVAARLSDLVIITSDNPRTEDPAEIVEEVKRGIAGPADRSRPGDSREAPKYSAPPVTPHLGIVDRRAAIDRAIAMAKPDDVVVLAGKGHEKYQVIGDKELPFDDSEVARAALARRRGKARAADAQDGE
jgi:UDP-N-acetylmuramoyl-L-alanyl-D-glutamate--2,6-diaminopimelate ligase